jgi:YggT family protein
MQFEQAVGSLYLFIQYLIMGVVLGVVLLMLVRLALNYADMNPFSRPVIYVRRLSDPLVNPVRRSLLQFGFSPNITPLVVILITILLGWFVLQLTESILGMIVGIVAAARAVSVVKMVGWLLYGFLDIYALLIVIRIIFSWGAVSYANRVMRFLVNATDPFLVPLRRVIPPLGVFDISALVGLLLLWMLKSAVFAVMLRF